jgi:hypothetical protein
MPEISGVLSIDEERAELEAVIESLGRSSRLAQLLHYIGEKHFVGQSDQLSEYSIATEVFGRSKSTFDASEDAIARVEAHRLRKRLKEFYEGPGRNRPLQLTIPLGTYAPAFIHKAAAPRGSDARDPFEQVAWGGALSAPRPDRGGLPPHGPVVPAPAPRSGRRRFLLLAGLGAMLLCALVIAIALLNRARSGAHGGSGIAFDSQGAAPGPALSSVRLLAGYSGAPQTDSAGQIWEADRFFHGGGAWRRPDLAIARTRDPFMFQYWRTGDMTYDIPLRPGVYELHLYFATSEKSSESLSTFTMRINGNLILTGFDINSDAMGENIADERIFRDVTPAADGMLHIDFASERGAPKLNAIEIVPGIAHKQLPIRLAMQRTSYTDHSGQFWQPDNYSMNGRLSDQRQEIAGSPDPDLFSTERFGHFSYAIPVDTRDRYTLILHFVEFYFGSQAGGGGGVGNRLFKVMCNGETLLDNFDIYKEAGSLHVLTKTFYHLRPSAQGKLNLTFEPIANNATVSGIEVLDESE